MKAGLHTHASALYVDKLIKWVDPSVPVSVLHDAFDRGKRTGKRAGRKLARNNYQVAHYGVWKDAHDHNKADRVKAFEIAYYLIKVKEKFPHAVLWYAPFLEHTWRGDRLFRFIKELRELLPPDIIIINNPIRGGAFINMSGVVNEFHHNGGPSGDPGKGFLFSHDGEDFFNVNVHASKNKYKNAGVYWGWIPQFNLSKYLTEGLPRDQRQVTVIYKPLIKMVLHMLTVDKGNTHLPGSFVWKAQAEQEHDRPSGKSRDNKPVLLSTEQFSDVRIKSIDNKLLDTAYASGRLDDGRYVYRFNKFGHTRANIALRRTGEPHVTVFCDRQDVGTVQPCFRENGYKISALSAKRGNWL